jgi:Glycosyltransferase family 87
LSDRFASPLAEPLRLARGRLRFWSTLLAALAAAPVFWSLAHGGADWRAFAIAGTRVGTRALLHPPELWQAFVYLPAAAWAIAPAARLAPEVGFVSNALFMIACAIGAARVASPLYGIPRATMVCLVLAWWPTLYASAVVGQNATLGLLLAVLTIAGLVRGSAVLTALPLGLLLYKPTYALPLLALLVIRGRRRALVLVALLGVGWYLASVAATAGDWLWPRTLEQLIAMYAAQDFRVNGSLTVSLPGLLVRAGLPVAAIALVSVVALLALPALRRAGALEAGSAACLVGLALSPHALAYDAVLVVPMLAYAATRAREPVRTPLIVAVYLVAPTALLTPLLGFDPLAAVVVGGALAWIATRLPHNRILQLEPVADEDVVLLERSDAELDHGFGAVAHQGKPERRDSGMDADHAAFMVEEDDVDRGAHADRVDRTARLDPEPLVGVDAGARQQTDRAVEEVGDPLDARGDDRACTDVLEHRHDV